MKNIILLLASLLFCSCDEIVEYRATIYKKDIDIVNKTIVYHGKKIDGTEVKFETTQNFNIGDVVNVRPVFTVKKVTKL